MCDQVCMVAISLLPPSMGSRRRKVEEVYVVRGGTLDVMRRWRGGSIGVEDGIRQMRLAAGYISLQEAHRVKKKKRVFKSRCYKRARIHAGKAHELNFMFSVPFP